MRCDPDHVDHDVVDLITGLAWPVTVLVLALTFRKQVGTALGRIREVSTPAGTVKLDAAAERVAHESKELFMTSTKKDDVPDGWISGEELDAQETERQISNGLLRARNLADEDPYGAVNEAHYALHGRVQMVKAAGKPIPGRIERLIADLAEQRDKMIAPGEFGFSPEGAHDYVTAAENLEASLHDL